MKCASCGAGNPAGARYCVQCGAEQSMPTPIAAVAAAAMASRPRKRGAAGGQCGAGRARRRRPRVRRDRFACRRQSPDTRAAAHGAARGIDPAFAAAIRTATGHAPVSPARAAAGESASARRLTRRAAPHGARRADLAACFAVGIAAGIRAAGGRSTATPRQRKRAKPAAMKASCPRFRRRRRRNARRPTLVAIFADLRRAPAPIAGEPGSRAARTRLEPRRAAREAVEAPPAGASAALSPPVEIKPLPAKPRARAAVASAAEKAPAAAQPRRRRGARTGHLRARRVIAAAPQGSARRRSLDADGEELSRCTREDFIARVICDQRVRFRYCDGYWGKAAQCPGNPARSRPVGDGCPAGQSVLQRPAMAIPAGAPACATA